jgi:hypothetical protein
VIVLNPSTGDEWGFWQFYNSKNPVTATVPAGVGSTSNPLHVQNASADYWVGQQIVIGQGTSNAETAVIASFPDSSHMILKSPTTKPHSSGDEVWAIGATNGYHYNTLWSGVAPSGFASRGAGVPYLAGLVRPCEIPRATSITRSRSAIKTPPSSTCIPPPSPTAARRPGCRRERARSFDLRQHDPKLGLHRRVLHHRQGTTEVRHVPDRQAGHPKVFFEYDGTANRQHRHRINDQPDTTLRLPSHRRLTQQPTEARPGGPRRARK